MLEWKRLKEELKKMNEVSWEQVIREVMPGTLDKVDKQLKLLTDKVNELSEREKA